MNAEKFDTFGNLVNTDCAFIAAHRLWLIHCSRVEGKEENKNLWGPSNNVKFIKKDLFGVLSHTWSSLNSAAKTIATHPVSIVKCLFFYVTLNWVTRKLHHIEFFFYVFTMDLNFETFISNRLLETGLSKSCFRITGVKKGGML